MQAAALAANLAGGLAVAQGTCGEVTLSASGVSTKKMVMAAPRTWGSVVVSEVSVEEESGVGGEVDMEDKRAMVAAVVAAAVSGAHLVAAAAAVALVMAAVALVMAADGRAVVEVPE